MFRSSAARWIIAVVIVVAVLGLLRFKPWRHGDDASKRPELAVGFLPVT